MFPGGDLGDIAPDADEGAIELELVVDELSEDELYFWVELLNVKGVDVPLLVLSHHVCVVGDHRLQKARN